MDFRHRTITNLQAGTYIYSFSCPLHRESMITLNAGVRSDSKAVFDRK